MGSKLLHHRRLEAPSSAGATAIHAWYSWYGRPSPSEVNGTPKAATKPVKSETYAQTRSSGAAILSSTITLVTLRSIRSVCVGSIQSAAMEQLNEVGFHTLAG